MVGAGAELDVGGVNGNDIPGYRVDRLPYGGAKASGLGREGVHYAIQEMTELRLLTVKPGSCSGSGRGSTSPTWRTGRRSPGAGGRGARPRTWRRAPCSPPLGERAGPTATSAVS